MFMNNVGINPDEAAAYNIGDIQKRGYHRNGPSSAISDGGALNGDAPREIVYHDKSKMSSEGKTDFEIAYEKALGKSGREGQYSFGDHICFDTTNNHIVFIDHETLETEELADTFSEFINSLYEYED